MPYERTESPVIFPAAFVLILFFSGCFSPGKNTSSFPDNGKYKNLSAGKNPVFVKFEDTLINIFPLETKVSGPAGTGVDAVFNFPLTKSSFPEARLNLLKPSFDVDIITVPFKYRFPTRGFPDQLNTNFSGAVYAGLRNDIYHFGYKKNSLGEYTRFVSHHGYGFGVFAGLGSTAMNPWVTLGQINIEYDGFIFITGAGVVFALHQFNFGVGVGIDHLMDKNRKLWIYRGKPWLGLTAGVNLN